MQRRIAVLGGLVALLMAAAPAAWAIKQPFNVDVPIAAQGPIKAGVPVDQDTGLVGFCDPEFQCTGFRASAYTTEVTAGTSAGEVTLTGYVCVMDTSAECTSDPTEPFTGVQITDRRATAPGASVDPFVVHVNFCFWVMSPQEDPHACDVPAIAPDETTAPNTGPLLTAVFAILPQTIGLNF